MNIATVKAESITSWRQNVLDKISDGTSSNCGVIDRLKQNTNASTVQGTKPKGFYFILEKESPPRIYESDVSTYSSYHCKETDICRDSSDTESMSSFSTEARMLQVEYEVASESQHPFTSNVSSSGTEDIFLTLAEGSLSVSGTSSCSSDFADTEYSDSGSYDSELSAADYWHCVKCKNKQNNPKFRFCEKCFQMRKNHVPPRPRLRKPRTLIKSKSIITAPRKRSSISPSSDVEEPPLKRSASDLTEYSKEDRITNWLGQCSTVKETKQAWPTSSKFSGKTATPLRRGSPFTKRKINSINNSSSRLNSAAETSTDESSDVDYTNELSIGNQHTSSPSTSTSNLRKDNVSTNNSSSANKNMKTSEVSSNNCRLSNSGRKRKLSSDSTQNVEHSKHMKMRDMANKDSIKKVVFSENSDCENSALPIQKDSGISSGTSSQEPIENYPYETVSSQEIFSDIDLKTLNMPKSAAKLKAHSSDLTPISESITLNSNNLIRSASSCSADFATRGSNVSESVQLDNKERTLEKSSDAQSMKLNTEAIIGLGPDFIRRKNGDSTEISNYGNCMMCLSEPKNGVFVHNRCLHLCCCYKCAVKIFNKRKRCPICNCAVKNVMKLFVY